MTPPAWTLRDCLREGERQLDLAGVDHPRFDAEYLLVQTLGVDRAVLAADPGRPCPAAAREAFLGAVRRRAAREPVQYILGRCHFWRDVFRVTPDVLIPRPETELLVEIGLECLRGRTTPRVLDLAAGSGCVGLSLARSLPGAVVFASDLSPAALRVADENARRLGFRDRWHPVAADGLSPWRDAARWDYIASNPPYIPEAEWGSLPPEVAHWEPRSALAGGEDGLAYYRRWLPAGLPFLTPGGALALEIGAGQWAALQSLAAALGCGVECRPDLAGVPRVVIVRP
ncbi:MAG: peptide chain release factor N(5)-glutamine methyltransferase [Acidobacteria bacterium]|nr:peptide chain release factor N(5)-glutamine methyltransferase [Acidobacteriota bacterium]